LTGRTAATKRRGECLGAWRLGDDAARLWRNGELCQVSDRQKDGAQFGLESY